MPTDEDRLVTGLLDVMELIAPGAQVTAWNLLPGGIGHLMHRVDVTMPSGAETAIIVRRFGDGFAATHALREAETLEALRGTHVPAPEMLWLDADGAVFGRPALVETVVPGRPNVAPDTGRWAAGLAEGLAALHLVEPEVVPHLTEPTRAELVDFAVADAEGTGERFDVARIADVLRTTADAVQRDERRLVHGDYHAGNVLRDDVLRISGVVDWDWAAVGDPVRDVGYTHYDTTLLGGEEVATAFLERYVTYCGRDVSTLWWHGLLAVLWSLPDPSAWLNGHRALGADLPEEVVLARVDAYIDTMLTAAGRSSH